MEPKFQTSFIPKKPVVSGADNKITKVYSTNIFSVIATVFFLVTIITSGGLYFYKMVLNNQISQAQSEVNAASQALQVDKIQSLINANSKIKTSQNLLEKHIIVSKLLALLQTLTIKNVHFAKLIYTNNGTPSISMPGEAGSYNALIQQQSIISGNEFMKNPTFTGFTLGPNGKISFNFSAELSPDLVSYKKSIESQDTNQSR